MGAGHVLADATLALDAALAYLAPVPGLRALTNACGCGICQPGIHLTCTRQQATGPITNMHGQMEVDDELMQRMQLNNSRVNT